MPQTLRMTIYRYTMRLGEPTSSHKVNRLPFGLYAKVGNGSNLVEALATQYVSRNTSVPVPIILDVTKDNNGTLFLMTRVPGQAVADMEGGLNAASPEQLSVFTDTIRDWLTQLQSLTPPSDGSICGFLGGDFSSHRILFDERVGPFESQDVFHAQMFCTLWPSADPAIAALARTVHQKRYRMCFTHGDLSPDNILVDHHFRPIGLVDLQCAAWMPEHWDFTTALWRRQRYVAWFNAFTQAFPQYRNELAVEIELWKTICPF